MCKKTPYSERDLVSLLGFSKYRVFYNGRSTAKIPAPVRSKETQIAHTKAYSKRLLSLSSGCLSVMINETNEIIKPTIDAIWVTKPRKKSIPIRISTPPSVLMTKEGGLILIDSRKIERLSLCVLYFWYPKTIKKTLITSRNKIGAKA